MLARRANGNESTWDRRGMRSRATTPGAEESNPDCDLFLHPHHCPFSFFSAILPQNFNLQFSSCPIRSMIPFKLCEYVKESACEKGWELEGEVEVEGEGLTSEPKREVRHSGRFPVDAKGYFIRWHPSTPLDFLLVFLCSVECSLSSQIHHFGPQYPYVIPHDSHQT